MLMGTVINFFEAVSFIDFFYFRETFLTSFVYRMTVLINFSYCELLYFILVEANTWYFEDRIFWYYLSKD